MIKLKNRQRRLTNIFDKIKDYSDFILDVK